MNRTVLALGLAAVVAACSGGRLLAQPTTAAAPPLRVAVVNIGLVFSKYDKAKAYNTQLQKILEPYQLDGKKLKKEILAWTETMKDPKFDRSMQDRYEQGIRANQRKLEDLELTVRKLVGKTQDDQIISLYKEVKDAIQSYALSHGIHVVMGYGEQIDGDVYSAPNILRKMQGMDLGSCNPLYVHPSIEISQAVADNLNAAFQRAGGASGVLNVSGTQK